MEMTRERLEQMYVHQCMTAKMIADVFGYKSTQTILNALRKHGIAARRGRIAQNPVTVPRDVLERMYIQERKSCRKIAEEIGASEETIRRLLLSHGIPRRDKTDGFGGHNKGVPMLEDRKRYLSEKRKEVYASGSMIHWNTGRQWSVEVRGKISSTLLSGRDPAPSNYGSDWRIQRTSCLQRDGYKCQQCGGDDDIEVHHWEPYRFSLDNSLDNLVTLCADCHRSIHAMYRSEGFISEAEESMYA